MTTVLVTGASRGIGREFVHQYRDAGYRVIATCRDPESAGWTDRDSFALDVDDAERVEGLAQELDDFAIDILINNAGINLSKQLGFGSIDYEAWDKVMRVNVFAPLRVAEAFAPHVIRSERKQVVFVSSIMGSITLNGGGMPIYRASKAALNQAVKSVSSQMRSRGITSLLIHPGWVKTDMGGPSAQLDVGTSVAAMRDTIEQLTPSMAGMYVNYDGTPIAW
jgi:NAD(P)-dependent dehydrogenase (short-subunit alcohol dehydrogenase family)